MRLTAIYDSKPLRVGTPSKVANQVILLKSDAQSKVIRGAKQVKPRLLAMTFGRTIDIDLSEGDD